MKEGAWKYKTRPKTSFLRPTQLPKSLPVLLPESIQWARPHFSSRPEYLRHSQPHIRRRERFGTSLSNHVYHGEIIRRP